ncbi:MAG: hypothetical protein R2751_10645 [Bacteroidales bacterium]
MKHFIRQFALVAAALALLVGTTACDKEPVDERPDLPPMESILMDFSDFEQQPAGTKSTAATYEHFLSAYLSVAYWNVVATAATAVPVAAYGYLLQQDAVYLGDHTWEWSVDFTVNLLQYTATLTGARLNNETFSMEMKIALAATPQLAVKWFDGEVRYDHTHAEWFLYEDGTTQALKIVWNKDFEAGDADLTYTYVKPDQDETGSFISWAYVSGADLDASYTIDLSEGDTFIEWSTADKNGRIQSIPYFDDADWRCWDTAANGLADIDCP